MAKLYVKAFAVSCGIVAAGITLIVGVLNMLFFLESGLNKTMAMIYLGYRPTLFGVVMNSLFCFVLAFCIAGAIAWLYNRIIDESGKEIDEKIKAVARSIWEAKGKPDGNSADNWKEAEKSVRGF